MSSNLNIEGLRLESRYRTLARVIAALVMLTGCLVLFGWFLGIESILRLAPGLNPMRFNAALCLVAAGGGVWLIAAPETKRGLTLTRWLGLFVLVLAGLTLAEHVFAWDLHLDQFFFRDVFSDSQPGRMVPATAIFFVLTGTFLIFSTFERTALLWAGQIVAIIANLSAQGAVLELIFRADKEHGPAGHTAASMFVLSIGMLLVPNRGGGLASLVNATGGGRIIRRLVPTATLAPLAAGWIYLNATRGGWVNSESGVVIMVVLYSAALLFITLWTAHTVDSVDLRLTSIIDSSEDAISSKSLEGAILTWNRGAERLYGYTAAEAIGQSMLTMVPPERHAELQRRMGCIREGELSHPYETVRLRKDGTSVNVSLTLSPVRNARGDVVGCSAISRDITQRKQVESRLQETETAYRTLAEVIPQLIWKCTPDGLNVYFNQRWVDYTGLTLEESYGRGWSTPFHPDDKLPAWKAWNYAVETGETYRIDCRLRSANGDYRWFLIKGVPLREPDGSIQEWFGTCTDIDDLKRAEEEIRTLNSELEDRVEQRTAELRESERAVRRKLESVLSPEGDWSSFELRDIFDVPAVQSLLDDLCRLTKMPVAIIDLQGEVIAGAGWQEICTKFHRTHCEAGKNCLESDVELTRGVAPGEIKLYKCKNNMWDVVTPIMLGSRHIGNLFSGQFLLDDEPIDTERFTAQAKRYGFDEQQYLSALSGIPRFSREEVSAGMAVYSKLTENLSQLGYSGIKLARAMAETNRANADLTNSSKELEAFAYSVSHDLRAPLRHLDGFLTLLSRRSYATLDAQAKHYIDCMLESSQRMGRLIDELLQFSRLGRSELHKAEVSLNRLVEEVQRELEPESRGRAIDWLVNELPVVEADQAMMRQVMENLVGNALKFTRHCISPRVAIGWKRGEGGELVVYVQDNGAGFDMRYSNKLFQVFQRLHGEDEFEGTGIGLANVRRIVERHGGSVWAEGTVGCGATFYFSLPHGSDGIGGKDELIETHLVG